MKKLSIITINYNDASGLKKTIKSVISQSFRDFEYIVVDGNSDDGSKDIIKQYQKDIDIAISEPDTGIYNAMNKGAKLASGEYLLFLNSGDNLYTADSLKQLFDLNPSSDIVSSCCIEYDKKRRILKTPPEIISLYTFNGGSLSHPSTIIKTDLLKKMNGYIEEYKIISDWCFFIDALLVHNCSYTCYNIILSEFNCFGISSKCSQTEALKSREFLQNRFGYIMNDYPQINDEALFNVVYWINGQPDSRKKYMTLPFKVINRILKLRNRLSKKIGVKFIK